MYSAIAQTSAKESTLSAHKMDSIELSGFLIIVT